MYEYEPPKMDDEYDEFPRVDKHRFKIVLALLLLGSESEYDEDE